MSSSSVCQLIFALAMCLASASCFSLYSCSPETFDSCMAKVENLQPSDVSFCTQAPLAIRCAHEFIRHCFARLDSSFLLRLSSYNFRTLNSQHAAFCSFPRISES